jgi:hypothetical protein
MGAPLLLSSSVSGTNLQLESPFSGAASQLAGSTSLSGGALWSSITNPVSITGTVFSLTLPLSNSSAFFRLQSQ